MRTARTKPLVFSSKASNGGSDLYHFPVVPWRKKNACSEKDDGHGIGTLQEHKGEQEPQNEPAQQPQQQHPEGEAEAAQTHFPKETGKKDKHGMLEQHKSRPTLDRREC